MEISINNLTKRYKGFVALDGLNLEIPRGMFGLLGPNGAGKTTLMKIMATVMYPTSGTILIDGYEVSKNPEMVRKKIGYLPQSFGFYPNVTVGTFLEYVGVLKGMDVGAIATDISKVLEQVNLEDRRRSKIKTLSGGMKQRLGIAQAFLGDPEVLIVDEPTAGLDPTERVRFRSLLTEMSIGRTVILSTHILADVEESCNEVCVLDKGSILYKGKISGLKEYAKGQIWDLKIPIGSYEKIKNEYNVLDVRRKQDDMYLRVLSSERPIGGVPAEPDVELGYFCILNEGVG